MNGRSADLAAATAENSAFSRLTPGLQLAWDSTSLGRLKECPRKYELSIIFGWAPVSNSVHLMFGVWYHAGKEKYHRMRAEGAEHDVAVREALRHVLELSGERKEYLECTACAAKFQSDCGLVVCSVCTEQLRKKSGFFPWASENPHKNRPNLVRTLVWYLDQFKDDAAKTLILSNGKPAVELSFRIELPHQSQHGEQFVLCGHLDRIVEFGDARWIEDTKTTKNDIGDRYFEHYNPHNQMTAYTVAGRIAFNVDVRGVVIDAAQVATTFSRFRRGMTQRTEATLEEWVADTLTYIRIAEAFAVAQHWPMNDTACYLCEFNKVCAADPKVREEHLKAEFRRRTWNPLETREK